MVGGPVQIKSEHWWRWSYC